MLTVMIDVALGLILTYLILSVIASALMEAASYMLQSRANTLKTFLKEVLEPQSATASTANPPTQPLSPVQQFYNHPLVKSYAWPWLGMLGVGKQRPPDYVAPATFVSAVLDLAWGERPLDTEMKDWEQKIKDSQQLSEPLRKVMLNALEKAEGKFEGFRTEIETWFNGAMDQVSRAYKRNVQVVLFAIGLLLAIGLNIDTITITSRLLQDPVLRSALVQLTEKIPQDGTLTDEATQKAIQAIEQKLGELTLPIGWNPNPAILLEKQTAPDVLNPAADASLACTIMSTDQRCFNEVWYWNKGLLDQLGWHIKRLIGIIITALAVSQGAPFWFDLLKRATQARGSDDKDANS